MPIKVASWNIELRLSRYKKSGRGAPEQIIQSIRNLNADVIFLPEAYDANIPIDDSIAAALESMNYKSYDVPYDEGGPVRENIPFLIPYLRLMSRIPVENFAIFRLGELRNALTCVVTDPETSQKIRIIGIHLDDRSEELRQSEMPSLIKVIKSSDMPTVMVGDFNAMNGDTKKARVLNSRPIRTMNKLIPHREISSYAARASDMAIGTVLKMLESKTELRDVDIKHRPTTTPKLRTVSWLPSIRMIDIDHMLVSKSVKVSSFEIMKRDGGSDHRSISATISSL